MTAPGDVSLAGLAAQVAAELSDPTGSRVLAATIDAGDLSDDAARNELRRAAEALMVGLPAAAG